MQLCDNQFLPPATRQIALLHRETMVTAHLRTAVIMRNNVICHMAGYIIIIPGNCYHVLTLQRTKFSDTRLCTQDPRIFTSDPQTLSKLPARIIISDHLVARL